jgi:hypothetical protein
MTGFFLELYSTWNVQKTWFHLRLNLSLKVIRTGFSGFYSIEPENDHIDRYNRIGPEMAYLAGNGIFLAGNSIIRIIFKAKIQIFFKFSIFSRKFSIFSQKFSQKLNFLSKNKKFQIIKKNFKKVFIYLFMYVYWRDYKKRKYRMSSTCDINMNVKVKIMKAI